jgi:hypothetical protein
MKSPLEVLEPIVALMAMGLPPTHDWLETVVIPADDRLALNIPTINLLISGNKILCSWLVLQYTTFHYGSIPF